MKNVLNMKIKNSFLKITTELYVSLSRLTDGRYILNCILPAELWLGSSATRYWLRLLHQQDCWRTQEMGGGVEGWMDAGRLTQTQEVPF